MKIIKIEDPKEKSQICENILRALPNWFGIESAILDYIKDVQKMEMWAAIETDAIGFVSLNKHNDQTAEIHVMGLLSEFHGKKFGSALIQAAQESLISQRLKFLTVKTLSESRSDENYDKTRKFYLKSGFTPIEEFKTLWGEHNPCLMMVKSLDAKPYRSTYLSHVEIYVSDYAKTIRFYDKILKPLGWERLACQKSHTTFSDGAMKIVFCPTEEKYLEHGYHRKRIGLNHLAFYAATKESVDTIYETVLKAEGISCLYDERPSGEDDYYAIFFEDPDRMKVEIVYSPGYCLPEHWTNKIKDDFNPYSEISK